MAYLFDTDALSEPLRRKPVNTYLAWLDTIPRAEQFTSAVCIGELYRGAFRVPDTPRHVRNIEARVLPAVTVLPYDVAVARVYGEIEATLARAGQRLADADLQIAATAIYHGLELVTANARHFARVPRLRVHPALLAARAPRP
jgi:predicted nucleic acid-binding protein